MSHPASQPRARLMLKDAAFKCPGTTAHFLNRLSTAGIARDRVTLECATPSRAAHLELYGRIDIALDSAPLLALRGLIAEHFHGSLTASDLYEPRPHITIQNKVTRAQVRALQAALGPTIIRRSFAFPALELHLYRDGPWELVKRMPFRGTAAL